MMAELSGALPLRELGNNINKMTVTLVPSPPHALCYVLGAPFHQLLSTHD